MRRIGLRAGILGAIAALGLATGSAHANHVSGATYTGTVTTGEPGGTVELVVSDDGTTVDFNAEGFGQSGCSESTFGQTDIPITNHSFFFSGTSPTRSVSGSFPSLGAASGTVRLSFACDSGFMSWSATTPIAAADALIGRSTDSSLLGNGVFNGTGEGQTRGWAAKRGQTRTFRVPAQAEGTTPGDIRVSGCASSSKFKVRYVLGGADVTAGVVAGAFTRNLDPGETLALQLKIRPKGSANAGQLKTCAVRASGDSNRDTVVAKVRVRRG